MKTTQLLATNLWLLCSLSAGAETGLAELVNPGFEEGWTGWTDGDPSGTGTAISDVANSGEKSVKLNEDRAFVSQSVAVDPHTTYRFSAFARGPGNLGAKVGTELFFEQQTRKSKKWKQLAVIFNSGPSTSAYLFASCGGVEVRFDDFRLEIVADAAEGPSARIISSSAGGYGLSPDLPPGRNFDLLGWYLSVPVDSNNDGKADSIPELDLAKGAIDERFFYTASDGGMVLRAPVSGARTSANTRFTRTELREMLRRGDTGITTRTDDNSPNKNNWVFSSAPERALKAAGGVDGTLRATLSVNHVTTTGEQSQVGRVIIGQIHAAKDEPIRLYYRKLPGNTRGSVYAAHEPSGGDDIYFELIGSRSNSAPDPADGIALDEKFSYEIDARGNRLHVRITVNDELRAAQSIDMSDSGYDIANEYMYFKAGVYNQNNSGDPDDYVQATFYELESTHDEFNE